MATATITSDMFENVTTHDLKNGDFVSTHGALFKLSDRKEWEERDPRLMAYGPTITFKTELVAVDENCAIPKHWRDDWTIQGNKRAKWAKLNKAKARAAAKQG